MRDRLSELQAHGTSADTVIQMEASQTPEQFLVHVNELRESLDVLQGRMNGLQLKQNAVLANPVVGAREKEELEELMDEIKQHIRSLRPRVKQIEADLRRDEASGSDTFRNSAQMRIRKNQTERLRAQLNDMMMLFNQTQVEYKSRVSKRVKRQLEMTGHQVTGPEVDEMLESKAGDIFFRELNPLSVEGRMALEDATNRHNEILQIEQSISELQEIFEDIFELVHQQGDMVNNIETNVSNAQDFTETGNRQVRTAVQYKKSAMRKKCCVITIVIAVLIILIVIAIILGVTLTGHGK